MTYDLDNLMSDVKTIMTSNLNTKISAINSEKADSITLASLDANAFFLQDLDHTTMNYDPFILYAVEGIEADGFGPSTVVTYSISIALILANQNTTDIASRMFRYQRALKEIFEENFMIKSNANLLSIDLMTPIPLESLNQSFEYRAIGIQLNTSIG